MWVRLETWQTSARHYTDSLHSSQNICNGQWHGLLVARTRKLRQTVDLEPRAQFWPFSRIYSTLNDNRWSRKLCPLVTMKTAVEFRNFKTHINRFRSQTGLFWLNLGTKGDTLKRRAPQTWLNSLVEWLLIAQARHFMQAPINQNILFIL